MTKKLKEIDPGLFEYEPQEPPDDDIWESMAMRGVSPDVLPDPEDRAKYERYLETFDPSE